jgi:hypothetical protein
MRAGAVALGLLVGPAGGQGTQQFAEDRIKSPELRDVTEWLNSKPLTLEKLKGRVVVIHFFTYG